MRTLALALAAGVTAQQHVCDPNAPGGCTVCDDCCHIKHNQTAKCDACFGTTAEFCASSREHLGRGASLLVEATPLAARAVLVVLACVVAAAQPAI
jgi:hypothetical protein